MVQLCVHQEQAPPTYPTPTPTKPEIKYEYIIAGVVILQMFRNYIPPCLQRTTYGAYKTCDLYNEETVFDYIAFNVI